MEETKRQPSRHWHCGWGCEGPAGTFGWPIGGPKVHYYVPCDFSGVQKRVLVWLWKSLFCRILILLTAKGHPSGARMTFRRVLSALWSKRKASYERFCLVAGPARGHLAPFGGLLVAKKVVIMSIFTFMGSGMEFWCHPGKLDFSTFSSFLAAQRGPPATPE